MQRQHAEIAAESLRHGHCELRGTLHEEIVTKETVKLKNECDGFPETTQHPAIGQRPRAMTWQFIFSLFHRRRGNAIGLSVSRKRSNRGTFITLCASAGIFPALPAMRKAAC